VALVKGDLSATGIPLVRVHIQDTLGDVIGVRHRSLGWPLDNAIERISREEVGVIVILREHESSRDLVDAVDWLGRERSDIERAHEDNAVLRTYGVGAQILRDLGLSKIRVLSAPKQMHAISGFDLEITEYVHDDR
ncbi:MAG: bifunctional 3,4-dihydroxy-2-butanone-4-phosphate synthase/GTP cyclohydrolase II, partial [Woeseiaceae bacterium]